MSGNFVREFPVALWSVEWVSWTVWLSSFRSFFLINQPATDRSKVGNTLNFVETLFEIVSL